MLVGPGQEEDLVPGFSMVARKDIRQYGRVGVTDMRLIIDVIDRCGDVEFFHFSIPLPLADFPEYRTAN